VATVRRRRRRGHGISPSDPVPVLLVFTPAPAKESVRAGLTGAGGLAEVRSYPVLVLSDVGVGSSTLLLCFVRASLERCRGIVDGLMVAGV